MSKRSIILGIAVLAVAAVAVAVFVGAGTGDAEAEVEPAANSAPAISLEYFDGSRGTLADYQGRPVVLNFWASWCPACIAEMPGFQAQHEALGDQVVFIGVGVQDTRDAALALVEQTGVAYTLADDPDGVLLQTFGGIAMPTTVFIDADGNIVETYSGFLSEELLNDRIQTMLRG